MFLGFVTRFLLVYVVAPIRRPLRLRMLRLRCARSWLYVLSSHIRRRSGLHAHACGVSFLSCSLSCRISFLSLVLVCPLFVWLLFCFSLCLVAVSGSFLSLLFLFFPFVYTGSSYVSEGIYVTVCLCLLRCYVRVCCRLVWLSILVRFVWLVSLLWFLSGSCFGFCLPVCLFLAGSLPRCSFSLFFLPWSLSLRASLSPTCYSVC